MAYTMTWLADVLRAAGCAVVEQPNWKSRGVAEMGQVRGILCHHTAGPLKGNAPSLSLVEHGRPDLTGPLSQLVLARDGTFYVLAAGKCNHAGAGSWQGITAGNSSFIGIEAENAGTGADPWPAVQIGAYARGCAAILKHVGADVIMCAGHKEYALPKGRKIDPSFDMIAFRERVAAFMGGEVPHVLNVAATDPARSMLRKGDEGEDVKVLQRKLGIRDDGIFGPGTETAVRDYQRAHSMLVDGLIGPKMWAALGEAIACH